ncbi:sarcinarray family MAST domain-containing protein [Methanolobus sp.]|uniref:sarcinarray family MAST domain-containing protein n=1 Tax=Methanolobus sp. TaxID=1874737 RepID=UPI0025E8B1A8|nr:sarcinarray family MAST domain-containing protein [Methanolobus sp.]
MNYKLSILCITFLLVFFLMPVSSASSNLKIDVYYNDQLYPEDTTPKPLLKIGEPFKLRFEVTCYKKNFLAVQLLSIGNSDFDIIEGPTEKLGTGTRGIIEANETRVFEWTVSPNEEWAGGSAPIDFYYQMTDLDTAKTITSGEFTAAYVTISEEYYERPETTAAPVSDSDNDSSPATPAFTALCAVFALVVVSVYRRK